MTFENREAIRQATSTRLIDGVECTSCRRANRTSCSECDPDPASFRHQRDQAHESIRELLALYDSIKRDVADALTYMDAGHYDEASEVLAKWAS